MQHDVEAVEDHVRASKCISTQCSLCETAIMRHQAAEETPDLKAVTFGRCSLVQLVQEDQAIILITAGLLCIVRTSSQAAAEESCKVTGST